MIALQVLFAHEFMKSEYKTALDIIMMFQDTVTREDLELDDTGETIPLTLLQDDKIDTFTRELIETIEKHDVHIDRLLKRVIQHWQLERLSAIDRNILRLGVAELLYFDDIPPKVTINEYIEVAKLFGDRESAAFVNGILDCVARDYKTNHTSLH